MCVYIWDQTSKDDVYCNDHKSCIYMNYLHSVHACNNHSKSMKLFVKEDLL